MMNRIIYPKNVCFFWLANLFREQQIDSSEHNAIINKSWESLKKWVPAELHTGSRGAEGAGEQIQVSLALCYRCVSLSHCALLTSCIAEEAPNTLRLCIIISPSVLRMCFASLPRVPANSWAINKHCGNNGTFPCCCRPGELCLAVKPHE